MNINGLLIFIKFVVFGSINFDNGTLLLSHHAELLRLGLVLTFHFALSITEIKIAQAFSCGVDHPCCNYRPSIWTQQRRT